MNVNQMNEETGCQVYLFLCTLYLFRRKCTQHILWEQVPFSCRCAKPFENNDGACSMFEAISVFKV
jgi:hypothetical protein